MDQRIKVPDFDAIRVTLYMPFVSRAHKRIQNENQRASASEHQRNVGLCTTSKDLQADAFDKRFFAGHEKLT